jgi:hypothetical protein
MRAPSEAAGRGGLAGDESRLVPAGLEPPLLVAHELEPRDERRELAVLEDVSRARARVALEVRARGVRDQEPAAGRELRGEREEQGPMQEVRAEDDVPRSARQGLRLEIDLEGLDGEPLGARVVRRPREGDVRDVRERDVEPTACEPERVPARSPRHVEGPATAGQERVEPEQERRGVTDVLVAVTGVPALAVVAGHGGVVMPSACVGKAGLGKRAAAPSGLSSLPALCLLVLLGAACGPKRAPTPQPPAGADAGAPAAPESAPQAPSQPAPAIPIPGPERAPVEGAVEPVPLRSAEELRAGVAAFARGGTDGPAQRAARALQLLASGLDRGDRAGVAGEEIRRLRSEAAVLSGLGAIDLDRAARLKAALDQAAAAVQRIAASRHDPWLAEWAAAAASAVREVGPRTPLELQLAPVQDALRSLTDAALVAWQLEARCAACPGTAASPLPSGR